MAMDYKYLPELEKKYKGKRYTIDLRVRRDVGIHFRNYFGVGACAPTEMCIGIMHVLSQYPHIVHQIRQFIEKSMDERETCSD